ncbi:MAG: hypothetical protein AAFR61_18980 [Bacteroidota bacterium]
MQHLHLIAFDVPAPPNYGGVIDIYYKVRALYELGIKVHLHCFDYGRGRRDELNIICERVYYYPRKSIAFSLPIRYPHIVSSRRNKQLLKTLLQDDYPILFEGLHTTYYLAYPEFEHRLTMVRMHNVEWEYYYQLAQREGVYKWKQYYLAESKQLEHFENILTYADYVFTISPKDQAYYQAKFPQSQYLPAFHAHNQISSKTGQGRYCLYHGKLSVAENHEAALFLINEVFAQLEVPLIIAGSDPQPELIRLINEHPLVTLRHNLGEGEMLDLMRDAHIHVLPTFQSTGIKLKLIHALFTGRFILVNPHMVHETGLAFSCVLAQSAEEFQQQINTLMDTPFTEIEKAQRRANVLPTFSNQENARRLAEMIRKGHETKMETRESTE